MGEVAEGISYWQQFEICKKESVLWKQTLRGDRLRKSRIEVDQEEKTAVLHSYAVFCVRYNLSKIGPIFTEFFSTLTQCWSYKEELEVKQFIKTELNSDPHIRF